MGKWVVAVVSVLAVTACGGRRATGDSVTDAGSGSDAGGRTDAGHGDAGPGADAGATNALCTGVGMASGGVLTNLPSVGYVNMGSATLHLVSSSFVVPYAGVTAVDWVGEVKNDGTTIVCPEVTIDIGGPAMGAAWNAAPHSQPGEASPIINACIDPGEVGVAYQAFNPLTLSDVMAQGTIHYTVMDEELSEVPDPARPTVTVSGTMFDSSAGWYKATGTVVASSLPITNVSVAIYPRASCGLLGDAIEIFPTVSPGTTAPFTSDVGSPFDFTTSLVFADYIRE